MSARLRGVSSRQGVTIAFVGQPGIGKTHNARELLAGLPFRSAVGQASSEIGPLLGLLPNVETIPRWTRSVLERLGTGEPVDEQTLADALAARLAALTPFALLIEDLHELAADRAGLWFRLARSVQRTRGLALLVTSREPVSEPFEQISVAPLNDDEIRALIESEVGAEVPPEALAWIARRAAGNPLFALEYFRHLARQGFLWSDTRRWRWREPDRQGMPTSIEALISHRLRHSRRSEAHGKVINALSFLSGALDASSVGAVIKAGSHEVTRATHDLHASGILQENEFAHPLYREVAVRDVPASERQQLAKRVVALLEDEPLKATPYLRWAQLPAQASLRLLVRAAQEAEAGVDRGLAAQLLAEAGSHASGTERKELLLRAARRYRHHNLPRALALTEEVLADDPGHAEAMILRAEMLVLLGRAHDAEGLMRHLAKQEALRIRWQRLSLSLHAERGDFKAAVRIWRGDPQVRASAPAETVRAAAFSLQELGELDEAELILKGSLEDTATSPGVDRALLLHAHAAARFHRGDYLEAESNWAEAAILLRASEEKVLLGRALGNRVAALRTLARFQEAMSPAQEAVRIFSELGLGRDYARQRHNLANLLRSQAEFERAEEMLLESREVFERGEDARFLIACDIDLAFLYLAWDRPYAPSLTIRHAHAALDAARRADLPSMTSQALRVAARAEAHFGDASMAMVLVNEAIEIAIRLGQPQGISAGIGTRGHVFEELGRRREALADFRESARLDEQTGKFHAQDFALEVDRFTGDVASARKRLEFFRSHGLKNMAYLTCRYFPELASDASVEPPAETIHLEVLGPLRLSRVGRRVEYRARKGRELLARLLEARICGGGEVGQLELQETLYPEVSDQRSRGALQQLIYRLRTALGADVVLRTQNGYMLGAVTSDAEQFLAGAGNNLWRGAYLDGVAEGWEPEVRNRLQSALRSAAEAALEHEPREASRLARLLMEDEPYDWKLLMLTLMGFDSSGDIEAARQTYCKARLRFAEVGEPLPESWRDFMDRRLTA